MKKYITVITTALVIIANFYSASAENKITYDGVNYELRSDGTAKCTGSLESCKNIIIPKTLTYDDVEYSVSIIQEGAFKNKYKHKIVIPNTVKIIGSEAFYGTTIDSLIIEDGTEYLDTGIKMLMPDYPGDISATFAFGGWYDYVYAGRDCDLISGYQNCVGEMMKYSIIDTIVYGPLVNDIKFIRLVDYGAYVEYAYNKITNVNILKSDKPVSIHGTMRCESLNIGRNCYLDGIDGNSITTLKIASDVSILPLDFNLGNLINLKSLTIPRTYTNFDISDIMKLTKLDFLEIESGNPQCVYDNGMLLNNEQSILYRFFANNAKPAAEVSLPELSLIKAGALKNAPFRKITAPRLTVVEDSAFYNSQLAELVTDGELTAVGEAAFYNCKISDVKLGDNIVDIKSNTFYNCENLSLDDKVFPKLNSVGDGAFHNCLSLDNTVKFDNVLYIGESAFCGTGIKSVEIDGPIAAIPDSVFANCTALESIAFGENTAITEVGECGFMNCPKLSFGEDFIPGLEKIGAEAFRNTAITEVKLNEAVDVVYDSTFDNCRKLTYADLGERVRSIGKDAFKNCDLRTVRLGSALRSVGDGAFNRNFNLENVYCNSTLAPEAYDNSFLEGYDATLHVPKGARQRYMIASGWRYFANIVQDESLSDVDEVTVDGEEVSVEYYDMQGRRVESPVHGIYIKRQGTKVEKVTM
ncbi:MAG: leucine-rich repeat domain-containing protein [Muribaculaceae bacterium]|nr:leucine-rich repeat domain-containing protein [Muribaculaceae bacterium]